MKNAPAKLPYEAPAIQTLGSVQDLTLAKSPLNPKSDGYYQVGPGPVLPGDLPNGVGGVQFAS